MEFHMFQFILLISLAGLISAYKNVGKFPLLMPNVHPSKVSFFLFLLKGIKSC